MKPLESMELTVILAKPDGPLGVSAVANGLGNRTLPNPSALQELKG